MLGLTQTPCFIFDSLRSATIQTNSLSLNESYFSLTDERKEDFWIFIFIFFTMCVGGGGSMCSLAGSQLSFPEFLRLNLFFLKCRFGAWLLLVTTVLHTYCHTYTRMQLTFCISFVCLFFPCGAQKSRVCTTAGQVTQIILSLLDCLFSWAEDKPSKHAVLQFY